MGKTSKTSTGVAQAVFKFASHISAINPAELFCAHTFPERLPPADIHWIVS